jgi:hypothetical protein
VGVDLSRGSASNGVEPGDVTELEVVLYNESAGALAGDRNRLQSREHP